MSSVSQVPLFPERRTTIDPLIIGETTFSPEELRGRPGLAIRQRIEEASWAWLRGHGGWGNYEVKITYHPGCNVPRYTARSLDVYGYAHALLQDDGEVIWKPSVEVLRAAMDEDWRLQQEGPRPRCLDKTRFQREDGSTAVLCKTRIYRSPHLRWGVEYTYPNNAPGRSLKRNADEALAQLAERGYVPTRKPLHPRMQPYWMVQEGKIHVRLSFQP